jgi:hypothetical protein
MPVIAPSLSAPKEIPDAAKSSPKARSFTSSNAVGAVASDPVTNFRPLFLLPLQQTMPALNRPPPRHVVSR